MNTEAKLLRVAVAQFHVGADLAHNLANCLKWLDKASECGPDLVVLPEFCNHLSWYDDQQHCYRVSVALDGEFLRAIAEKAAELGIHVVVNCTVQREDGTATGSSLLYSSEGELLLDNTKQIYIGHENDVLARASREGQVVATELGRVGLYACMDGVINETPRCLALNGAQLMLNSLNSFATDEASLHIPVRAAENKVYVIAANKVGPLVPEELVDAISEGTGIPQHFLSGAGESQIVAPSGEVLAKASLDKEEYVFADIDVSIADDKRRPDGTDIFRSRRPHLYRAISEDPSTQPLPPMSGIDSLEAAVVTLPPGASEEQLIDRTREAVQAGATLVALPPLLGPEDDLAAAATSGAQWVQKLSAICEEAVVTTAVVRDLGAGKYQHCAIAINGNGVVLCQGQMHFSERYSWSELSDQLVTAQLPMGRLALVTSDDSLYPELFRLLAMAGAEVAAVPLSPLEDWELETGLLERSAENRINLLVAVDTRRHGDGFITELQTDFTVMTPWQEREFDGLLSQPVWHRADSEGVLIAKVRPANAAHKVVSLNTDLLANRPWDLAAAISRI